MKNNNALWWIVGIIAIVLVLVMVFKNKDMDVADDMDNAGDDTALIASEDLSEGSANAPKGTGSAPASISYTNALEKYKDKRIQFDNNCAATPNTVTYKDNTGIMLDNRSATARTIKVGTTYTVKPWGFKIVILPDTYLKSSTILIDCDKQQNVATILVQE